MMETILIITLLLFGFILLMILAVIAYSLIVEARHEKKVQDEYKYYLIRVNKVGELQIKKYNPGGGNKYPKF